jgi:Bacterial type III secretion protein (HrpB1_HrpK)
MRDRPFMARAMQGAAMSDELELRNDVVDALVVLVGTALFQNQEHDAIVLCDALRPWRGTSVELRFYDAWLAMRRDDFALAAQLLQALHEQGAGRKASLCRALLAATLLVLDDPRWQGHAEAVLDAGENLLAMRFASQLLGRSERHHSAPEPSTPLSPQSSRGQPAAAASPRHMRA